MYLIGIDIGSVSVKAVLMTTAGEVLQSRYRRSYGRSLPVLAAMLDDLFAIVPPEQITGIAATGSGAARAAELLGCRHVNEVVAQGRATATLHPEVRSIIEIGGEDAKLIILGPARPDRPAGLADVALNTVCAAGTGSFLDQQAQRLGIAIEEEFGRLACMSRFPPAIAGRCSVFAKSDMIHLQQAAAPLHDIVMGLCMALARTFKSTIVKNRVLPRPIAFQGGVAANAGMVRAFEKVLELQPGELIIPHYSAFMGAIGAVLTAAEEGSLRPFAGRKALERALREQPPVFQRRDPLPVRRQTLCTDPAPLDADGPVDAYIGVDVGSISTNLAVVDAAGRVIARRYLMTAGRPIEAVRQGLCEIGDELGGRVVIRAAATTGSGRYLTGDLIGADVIVNEITAHAAGALSMDPRVDTIFEIGGQDSKYIRLEHGAVVDFTMNKVCAAGTGSFLEEQAERLGVSIKDEFSRIALSSQAPAALGERCTVFMESSITRLQQQGAAVDDLAAGLCYAIVHNYLSKVVEDRPVGDRIFFQGGTAYNQAVTAAFEKICGKQVTVPPHHDVLGAVGCALIARDRHHGRPSRFRGFDVGRLPYAVESFECSDCPNACLIRRVVVEERQPLHYGSRCGKYDEAQRPAIGQRLPKLFAERERLLLAADPATQVLPADAPVIGMPRATIFHDQFPFWQAFFATLGFRLIPSAPTNRKIINHGCAAALEEPCLPIKAAHGHILALLEQGIEYLFLPCMVNADPAVPGAVDSYLCLFVQSLPFTARAALDLSAYRTRVLSPVLHPAWGEKIFLPQLANLARDLGCPPDKVTQAYAAGRAAQERFARELTRRGREAIAAAPAGTPVAVLIGRPYTTCDQGLTFNIPEMLRDLGALAVPLDMLGSVPADNPELRHMYWRSGQRILGAAAIIAGNPRLQAIYVTNFGCGPDSFITKHFRHAMAGKPYLTLELDEHSADAGVLTRIEAFLDSLPRSDGSRRKPVLPPALTLSRPAAARSRIVYIPYMDDHGIVLAAALRRFGVAAEPLPMADEETLACAAPYVSGKECYPFMLTIGDIVKKTRAPDFDPGRAAFLMASAAGPCRFGQYARFHRRVLNELGLADVPIVRLDQTTEYDGDLRQLGVRFRRLGWRIVLAVDCLKKILLHTRPYERTPGDSDSIYQECLVRLADAVERGGDIAACCIEARRRFGAIAVDRTREKPLIGIVGEIYVRSNAFSNQNIVRKLEALGAEVLLPPLQEWVAYTDWERANDLRRCGSSISRIAEWLRQRVQQHDAAVIRKCFDGSITHLLHEQPVAGIMHLSAPYLSSHVRGEANLSVGRAVEYALHRVHGIINVMPFGCMPGTVVNALLCRFARDYPAVPVLKMVYDDTRQAGDDLRMETFLHQAREALRLQRGTLC